MLFLQGVREFLPQHPDTEQERNTEDQLQGPPVPDGVHEDAHRAVGEEPERLNPRPEPQPQLRGKQLHYHHNPRRREDLKGSNFTHSGFS